jgi:hypothetical protein
MIRLVRAAQEPEPLRVKRPDKLADARVAIARREKIDFSGYGDDGAKEQIFEAQHRKCAYCEKREERAKYRDTEHYRPKSPYWWLAWTWENLLFACIDCNRDYKKNQFPLLDERQRLAPEELPPGSEVPLLIDPYDSSIDLQREIEFRRDDVQGQERWKPYGLTTRGAETIRICGLDRQSLLTEYKLHVRETVWPKVEKFRAVADTGAPREIQRAWASLKLGLFWKDQPYQALSRDALKILTQPVLRERYQLSL